MTGITPERLRELFSYDPATGLFVRRRTGRIAGGRRYISIWIDGHSYLAHRLAWLYSHGRWPDAVIDHADGDKTNNRLSNLREATQWQNCGNRRRNARSQSGFKGVNRDGNRWRARIKFRGTYFELGHFDTPEAAHGAYAAAAPRYFGKFARAA